MRFESLRIQGLRCLTDVSLTLEPGIQVLVGDNGAGKTRVLEATFLLSHARSFRSGAREALVSRASGGLSIYAELRHSNDRRVRLGLGRQGARWEARVDGEHAPIGQLVRDCAVVCFEPGSHALIAGAAEERRRYLDWGVFHVEHQFLTAWRRYQQALRQRNSLLRGSQVVADSLLIPWELELSQAATQIDTYRQEYLTQLLPMLSAEAACLLPELGELQLKYKRGWAEDQTLGEQLASQRGRDISRGHTTLGAHRADWSISFEHAPQREHLSRGQEKLTALACVLAQANYYAAHHGEWPIVTLDDLASELDGKHQHAVVDRLQAVGAQVIITGTEIPSALADQPIKVFHVEQGQVDARALL